MDILFITPTLPYPPDNGGKIVVFNTIKYLAKRHNIFLLTFAQKGQEKFIPSLKEHCVNVEAVMKDISFSRKGLVLNLLDPIPYNMTRYYSPEMGKKLKEIIANNRFDVIQIEHLHLAQYARFAGEIPVILREHNVESKIMERYYKYASNLFERIYAYFQWKKLLSYEKKMCLLYNLVITLSDVDKGFLENLSPQINIEVVQCGVDFEHFKISTSNREKDKIVYIGGLNFKPAFEGVFYFIKEIWPEIRELHPQAKFHILGKCPPDKLRKIENAPGVTVLGYMEEVRTHMLNSTLGVVPYRIASGIRLKILESMAMGLPLVSTSIGCEGLEVEDGKHILIGDSPLAFANRVVKLLKDENLRKRLADDAFNFVKKKYTWENSVKKLETAYKTISFR